MGARSNAKDRARKAGIPFDMSLEDVYDALNTSGGHCVYCGCLLNFQLMKADMNQRRSSPSLDRIVPSKGYTSSNVVVCCYRCNAMKSDATPQELSRLARIVGEIIQERNL